ncbi:serine hydrolase domain-containing protein [Nocardioides sp. GCM10027113]|uniref:serine hydrolase domain-containing protein n=1 Tax=unclassified Nocardioides TaxID=2615069 RepID=UPI0036214515
MSDDRRQACLDLLQARGRLPSVVAAVLDGGDLMWVGGAGEVPAGDPADVQYRIGSITKTFVAVAVLRLRDAGLLSLDDELGRFVPESGYAAATLRSLLAHTSGMQSEPVGPWWERSAGIDVTSLVAANDASGTVAAAGEYHHYSNLGYALLGEVVARVRGAWWWQVVTDEVLRPLGMTRTSYDARAPHTQGYSVRHFTGELTREPHQDTGAMAPAGQAWSTVADLARWARFLAAGHPDVLDAATMREAQRPAAPAEDYGLGLRLLSWEGRRLAGHTGSMPGFLASCFVDPATGDGVVALANATTGLVTDEVPGLLLGGGPLPDLEAREPWCPTVGVPDAVAGLPGLWFWGNTALELRWHNEALELRALGGGHREDVFVVRDDRIVGTAGYHRGETLRIHRTVDGGVSHLECATFVYTRTPYDPGVEIPGGHPHGPGTERDRGR